MTAWQEKPVPFAAYILLVSILLLPIAIFTVLKILQTKFANSCVNYWTCAQRTVFLPTDTTNIMNFLIGANTSIAS